MNNKDSNKELEKKGIKAAKRFMNNMDYILIDDDDLDRDTMGPFDFVAIDKDDKTIVLVTVKTNDGAEFDEKDATQEEFEKAALGFAKKNKDYTSNHVRHDAIAISVISSDRAMIRHHVNASSSY